MRETGDSAGSLNGNKLYEQRARAALPIMVRQAKAGQTMLYSELAQELGMPNPRNLNYVLGAIGNSMLDLGERWGVKVPPIQALIVNKGTHLPGEGISWFAPDASEFKDASRRQRKRIVDVMLAEVYTYQRWDEILESHGLEPLPSPASLLPPVEQIAPRGGSGEGEGHRRLKEAITLHPEWLGLPRSLAQGRAEVSLYSGDRIDVEFADNQQRIAVEVKAEGAPIGELVRGLFQCIKYAAVLEAEASACQDDMDCRVILALGGELPTRLAALRATLGVDVRESVGDGSV
jgi:hypothetical protein